MISKRLFAIELTLLIGLSTIFLLPKAPATSPVGIAMKLPIWVGGWIGEDTQVARARSKYSLRIRNSRASFTRARRATKSLSRSFFPVKT